jgi:hypothetical protein
MLADLHQLMDIRRRDATLGDGDGRFHHRQRHALGAVAEQFQVAPLGGQHARLDVRIGDIHIAPDQRRELHAGLAVIALAVPERIVAVETDELEHETHYPVKEGQAYPPRWTNSGGWRGATIRPRRRKE